MFGVCLGEKSFSPRFSETYRNKNIKVLIEFVVENYNMDTKKSRDQLEFSCVGGKLSGGVSN